MRLDRWKEHDVDLELGTARPGSPEFVALLESGVARADGSVRLHAGKTELLLSTRRACPKCGTGYPELDPRFFSFNTRQGACATCEGQGEIEIEVAQRRKRDVHARAKETRGSSGSLGRFRNTSRAAEANASVNELSLE
jgi:excinuclease ABC subunit A